MYKTEIGLNEKFIYWNWWNRNERSCSSDENHWIAKFKSDISFSKNIELLKKIGIKVFNKHNKKY